MDHQKLKRLIRKVEKFSDLNDLEIECCDDIFGLHSVFVLGKKYLIKKVISFEMGEAELSGLSTLRECTQYIPESYGTLCEENEFYIVLEYIESAARSDALSIYRTMKSVYSKLGSFWGWTKDNFVGSLRQQNSIHKDFLDYFMQDRIEPLLRLTYDRGLIDLSLKNQILQVTQKKSLEWALGKVSPRLIHGDLWTGNIIQAQDGNTYLIDPSISFGHPEQDFAMYLLFGGGSSQWIGLVQKDLKLDDGFSERISFWQMYPLLVHVTLFGLSYLSSLKQAVDKY